MQAALILVALLAWNPAGNLGGRGSTTDATLRTWADAIAKQCASPRECLTLAALASEETRFAPYTLNGDCNNHDWRLAHKMDKACDGGEAYGPWSIHKSAWYSVDPDIAPPDTQNGAFDAPTHVWVAVRILRKRPMAWTTYRAATRDVDAWLAAHPVEP